jgi:predicted SprT family Zn-dependent metalloprotease
MSDMKIPKRFKLMGRTIEVEYDNQLLYDDDRQGSAQYRFNKIVLQPRNDAQPMPNLEQTFCHELIHWILYFSGAAYKGDRDHMHQEEGLVDVMACLMHQALTTMEYEND